MVRMSVPGTFDNFNLVVSGVKGSARERRELIFDTLMADVARRGCEQIRAARRSRELSGRRFSVTYRLRAKARWHDGKPVTPEDVIFSFDAFKKNSPMYSAYYRHVTKAEKTAEREVTFTFDAPGNRELPFIVGSWSSCRSTGGKEPTPPARSATSPRRRSSRRSAAASTGSRASMPGETSCSSGSRIIGARTSTSKPARTISTKMRFEYFRDLDRRVRGLQGRPDRLANREQRQELGDRLRFPRREGQARRARGIPDRNIGRHAGLRVQHPPRQVQGSAGAPRLQFRVRFRGDEQAAVLRPVQAHRQLFRRHRAG